MNYSHPDDVSSRCKPYSAGFVPKPQQISKFFGLNANDLRIANRSSQKKNISEVYTEDCVVYNAHKHCISGHGMFFV